MFLLLVIAFTVVPVVEISLLFEVGGQIGGWMTLWVVLLTGVIGASLARSQGRAILNQIQLELGQGEMPAQSVAEGFLIFAGGLLLLTPGFVTDGLGLLMVIPGSRHLFSIFLRKWMKRRLVLGAVHVQRPGQGGGFYHHTSFTQDVRSSQQSGDIRDAEVIDIEALPSKKEDKSDS